MNSNTMQLILKNATTDAHILVEDLKNFNTEEELSEYIRLYCNELNEIRANLHYLYQ